LPPPPPSGNCQANEFGWCGRHYPSVWIFSQCWLPYRRKTCSSPNTRVVYGWTSVVTFAPDSIFCIRIRGNVGWGPSFPNINSSPMLAADSLVRSCSSIIWPLSHRLHNPTRKNPLQRGLPRSRRRGTDWYHSGAAGRDCQNARAEPAQQVQEPGYLRKRCDCRWLVAMAREQLCIYILPPTTWRALHSELWSSFTCSTHFGLVNARLASRT